MSTPLTIRGKAILITVLILASVVCLYVLKLQSEYFLVFLFAPLLILVLGKVAELIIHTLEMISTGPLSILKPTNSVRLVAYYTFFSIFLSVLIENSIVLSILNFRFDTWQVATISLGLAFLPRVLSYAGSMERARSILLAILTPLTLTAAFVLFIKPAKIIFSFETFEYCFIGSLIQTALGDLTLYFASFIGIINPAITIETISLIDLDRLVRSQLETIRWDRICQILEELKQLGRIDVVQKVVRSMSFFLEESRKRRAKLARVAFADDLAGMIISSPILVEDLLPLLRSLQEDKEAEVRACVAPYCIVLSNKKSFKGLKNISEWVNDSDVGVLEYVATTVEKMLHGQDPNAPLYATRLSANPAFAQWLYEKFELSPQSRSKKIAQEHRPTSMYDVYDGVLWEMRPNPIIQTLKTAYLVSPDTISKHINECSLNAGPELRMVAAAAASDPNFAAKDHAMTQIRKRLAKDKDPKVRMALSLFYKSSFQRESVLSAHAIQERNLADN